jgi:phage regulator Rha-like protein
VRKIESWAGFFGKNKSTHKFTRKQRRVEYGDFVFQLNPAECEVLRSQFATSKTGRGGRRYLPFAFTEHGAIMLAAVLNTPRAIEVSVFVVRAFVRLREILATHRSLANKLAELEGRIETHDESIRTLVSAIRQLMAAPERPAKKIGFQLREKRAAYGRRVSRQGAKAAKKRGLDKLEVFEVF